MDNNSLKLKTAIETAAVNPVVVMKRYEMKYILSPDQSDYLLKNLSGHMEVDSYGKSSIASLYYDTPTYQLIRTSIEKPAFKEKIRLRSYGLATDDSPVYLELKRKAYGIVYKRRVKSTIPDVERFFQGDSDVFAGGQINREITAFRDFYDSLSPSCLIIYDRTAFFEPGGSLRLTIDENPRYRIDDLSLKVSMDGKPLLPQGYSLLVVKVQESIPLWLSSLLDSGKIFKNSFSKYGEAYIQQLLYAQ